MLLYDIFYRGNAMDRATVLPKIPPAGVRAAVCVNGASEYLVARRGKWVSLPPDEAKKHWESRFNAK